MPPPAPARFSITTGWPKSRDMASATGRATKSAKPPGGKGTIMVMERVGQVLWAPTKVAAESSKPASNAERRCLFFKGLSWSF
jgi:hypothetical protein